jgi:hypothetical protein
MVGTTTRCSWQRTSSQIEIQTSPDTGQHRAPRSGATIRALRLQQEIQAGLRRGDGELSALRAESFQRGEPRHRSSGEQNIDFPSGRDSKF